ncbi:hypothetical protein ACFX2I_038371 [Malus domestica]|uniref:Phytocyanin domain-containing protein n=1 Tax=Malus domestica TaxID=3750 RepID=A0A498JJT2_MALDO|nr:hypothetical protein DVH24_008310 [Malus domestica]
MANLTTPRLHFLLALQLLMLIQSQVLCYQYKVGDLDSWGIPTSANPQVYTKWSKYHQFKLGDSLLFLYPPSQDSVIQVTAQSYSSCNLKDPILYMNDGNSLFNFTTLGDFYFTSGEPGHCEKSQKLHISFLSGNGSADSPSSGPSSLDASAPSYPTVFGTIPAPPSSSSSSPSQRFPVFAAAVVGFVVFALFSGNM